MNARLVSTSLAACALALATAGCVTETQGGPKMQPDLPRAAKLNTELGVRYARDGMFARAQKKLERAVSEEKRYAPAHAALAYVYAQTGKSKQAEQEYRRALKLDPGNPGTQNNFGSFLCAHGKADEARTYFQKALANPAYATPAAAWTNAGVCARHVKKMKVAEKDFENALRADPDFPEALKQLAILSFNAGHYQRAHALENRYVQQHRADAQMLLLMARTQRALGHDARARALEVKLIQVYPQSPQAAQASESRP